VRRIDSVERVAVTRRVREHERAASLAAAEAELRAREEAEALAAEEAAARAWEPVPVPLPTYVTKPKATRRPSRTIDLTRPAWISGTGLELGASSTPPPPADTEPAATSATAAVVAIEDDVAVPRAVGD
jgi:hypothetical protein